MASSPFLSHYGIYKETDNFKFTFYIPNNCSYSVEHDTSNNVYTVVVTLDPAAKGPSPVFVEHSFFVYCDESANVDVEFQLPQISGGVGLAKKPKLTVSDLRA